MSESKSAVVDGGRKLYSMLFPGSRCLSAQNSQLDLDAFFRAQTASETASQKDAKWNMTDTAAQTALLNVASAQGTRCTYGGFLENRTQLWSSIYVTDPAKFKVIHLGIDINNVAIGQPVASLTDGQVFHVIRDHATQRGWGGGVVVKTNIKQSNQFVYILYAHLSDKLPPVGSTVKRGTILGFIGDPKLNGGWFPHLHLQVMKQKFLSRYDNLSHVDGYQLWPVSDFPDFISKELAKQGLIDPIAFVALL